MEANNTFIDSTFWNHTVLSPEDMLDKVEQIDEELVEVFDKSLEFASLLLQEVSYKQVESSYLSFASEIQGTDTLLTKDALKEELWAGYHPLALLFSRLSWYGDDAKYHYNDSENLADSEALSAELDLARKFHDHLPSNWLPLSETNGKGVFGKVLQKAEARFAFDTNSDLTVDQIVVLSGVGKRSVQNALSKKDELSLSADLNGMISHSIASSWLKLRRNFKFTELYRPDQDNQDNLIHSEIENDHGDFIFVPVTDDGIAFLPELRRTAGYQIGKYGHETYYQDYFDALKALQSMEAPKFRRPNADGNWGIKVLSSWKRVSIKDLSLS